MPHQVWIADAARSFGLQVVEVDGWRTRGAAGFNPAGVVCHHTAGPAAGDMPSLGVLINGHGKLPGPLCNVGLARSGTVYVVAAGRANHAGSGGWQGLKGNSAVLGIEAENTGRGEPWPAAQFDAYVALTAALVANAGGNVDRVCAHREWAPGRKIDPHGIDMNDFRQRVRARLGQGAASTPTPTPTPAPAGDEAGRITQLQQLVGAAADGAWGAGTEAACKRAMIGWPDYVRQHAPSLVDDLKGNGNRALVRWLQQQGNRKVGGTGFAEDGLVGANTNHLVVNVLGQGDGVCGPKGFREAVR